MPSTRYTCPLCSNQFGHNGESCHGSCPMSAGCNMIQCPSCKYEFVVDSKLVGFVRRVFSKRGSERQETAR